MAAPTPPKTGTLTTTTDNYGALAATLQSDAMMKQLRLACTRSVTPERLARIALTETRKNPKLLDCSRQSMLGALMQCAQLGLEPGPMGLAYLIPYGKEVQLQLGYKGLLQLVWRSELISSIQAEVVHANDHFVFANGIPPRLDHRPAEGERGEVTHVYCVIGTKAGGWIFRVMTTHEVEAIRKRSRSGSSGPWVTDWEEMACKTAIKRTVKRAPVSSEVLTAVALDDHAEIGIAQELAVDVETGEVLDAEVQG